MSKHMLVKLRRHFEQLAELSTMLKDIDEVLLEDIIQT